jgi:hypothetical protein
MSYNQSNGIQPNGFHNIINNNNNQNNNNSANTGNSLHNNIFINNQLNQMNQLNRTQSLSSSYTSTTSPSNFTSFSYNSPSAHPPSHISSINTNNTNNANNIVNTHGYKNSFPSRSGSIDNLPNSNSLINNSNNLPINNANSNNNNNNNISNISSSFNSISFSHSYSSPITPAGRRSLLTSKIQQAQAQQQGQSQQFSSSSSFSVSSQSQQIPIRPHDNFLRRTSYNNQLSQQNGNNFMQPTSVSSSYTNKFNSDNDSSPILINNDTKDKNINIDANQIKEVSQQSNVTNTTAATDATTTTNNNTFFTPYPIHATATTDISKDLAFSTNSSSSTLYQDAQSNINHESSLKALNGFPNVSTNQFISASAPVTAQSNPFVQPYPFQNQQNQQNEQYYQDAQNHQQKLNHLQHQQENQPQKNEEFLISNDEDHLNIAEYPVHDLLLMLSALLQKIVEANDLLHTEMENNNINSESTNTNITTNNLSDGKGLLNSKYSANVLAFHGRNIPAISLYSYLTRILKYCPVTNDVFLSLLVYFDRIAKRANNSDMTNEDAIMMGDGTDNNSPQIFVMDSYNIHRLIISGITVASKFFSDVFYKNSRYAKVGGLPLDELNHLELQFLLLLDFQLMIQVEELERYADLLLKFWKREQMKKSATINNDSNNHSNEIQNDHNMTDQ